MSGPARWWVGAVVAASLALASPAARAAGTAESAVAGGAAAVAAQPAAPGPQATAVAPAEAAAPAALDALIAAGDARYADDPALAADAYAEAAAAGGLDAARWVRLGNAYVRLGRPGPAMAAYRQAEARAPRLPALRANRDWLRGQLARGAASPVAVVDPDLPAPRADGFARAPWRWWSPAAWVEASRAWLTRGELAALALGAWWVVVLAAWRARRSGRRGWRWAAAVGGLALGLALALLGARLARRAASQPAIVVGPGAVAVRQGPGEVFGVLRALPEGAEARYVERRGGWLRLAESSGADDGGGWVAAAGVVDVAE